MKGSCPICCNDYTSKQRAPVECFACNKSACIPCIKTYMLSTVQDPHCMHCKVAWSRQFIDDHISKSFMLKEYKEHRENVLCEREKSKLVETQALWNTIQLRKANIFADVESLQQQRKDLDKEFLRMKRDFENRFVMVENAIEQRSNHMRLFDDVITGRMDTLPDDASFSADVASTAKAFIHPCPVKDCKGMLSSRYKCGVCEVYVCKECHQVLACANDTNHTCSEDDIATVKQIKRDTRPCPSCNVPIYKIDGCDQMWCTQCHTAFSWKTGKAITKGQIHNPHFYEWRRNNGTTLAAGAVDAQGCPLAIPEITPIRVRFQTMAGYKAPKVIDIIHQELAHIRGIELNERDRLADPTRKLRLNYLLKVISETQWKTALQKLEKEDIVRNEKLQLFDMYVDTARDIFLRIVNGKTIDDLHEACQELSTLGTYVKTNFDKISTRFNVQRGWHYLTWIPDLQHCIQNLKLLRIAKSSLNPQPMEAVTVTSSPSSSTSRA